MFTLVDQCKTYRYETLRNYRLLVTHKRGVVLVLLLLFVLGGCAAGPGNIATKTKIKRYESKRNIEQIIDIANSGDKRDRILALESLGRLKDPRAVKTLAAALKSSSWVERETAARSLGKLKDNLAITPLLSALDDEAKFVHESALKALKDTVVAMSKSRDLRYFVSLFKALNTSNINIADGALEALQVGVNIIKRIGEPALLKPLFAGLKDEQAYVRTIAAKLLGTIKDPSAVVPLIEAQNDPSKSVRDAASAALQNIKDERAVEPLIRALAHERAEIREEAADALGRFTDLKTVKRLLVQLKHDNQLVRYGVARALGDTGSAHAVKPLIAVLDDKDSEVRFAAAESLGKLFWFPENESDKARYCAAYRQWDQCVALGEIAIKPLLLALTDPDTETRIEVGKALKQLKWSPDDDKQKAMFCVAQRNWDQCIALGNLAIKALANELQSSEAETDIKISIVKTLSAIKDGDAVKSLVKALQDEDVTVRLEVVKALGAIKTVNTIPALIKALDNNSSIVRENAANVLQAELDTIRKVDGSKALNPIISALGDNNRNVRLIAARLLGELKNSRATIPLIQALEDPEFEVREEASKALKKIKDPKSIQPLLHALKSNNAEVRVHVVKTLGGFQDYRATEPVMAAITDRNPKVRSAVIDVLGEIKDPRGVTPLVKALADFDENVRIAAAGSLGKINSKDAVPALLERVSNDEVATVRHAAGQALLAMQWKPANKKQEGQHCVISRDWNQCLDVGKAAVDALMDELTKKDSPEKLQIARTLGGLRDPRSIKPLLKYMEESRHERDLNDQAEILLSTTAAIEEMGKEAIPHVLPVLTDWYLGKQAGIILNTLKWIPRSDVELVHYQIAKRAKGEILANWNTAKSVLLKDLESKDRAKVQNAAFALIGIGDKELINNLVIAINRVGNLDMAEAYINSGNDALVKASVNWALQNGEKIHPNRKGGQPVVWGEL